MNLLNILPVAIIYSGFIAFFLIPFRKPKQYVKPESFLEAYKQSIRHLLLHKKAIIVPLFVAFISYVIWETMKSEEQHINIHSGEMPISMDLTIIYTICGVLGFTIAFILLLALFKTIQLQKIKS